MSGRVRTRYAPSPTGHLHIGGARTALFAYAFARRHQGSFIVRFEDTDQTRHVESGIQDQLNGLRWLGIEWDESIDIGGEYGPYRQMERLELYEPYVRELLDKGHAYYCYCSEEELEAERGEQEARGETPRYSGKCRRLSAAEQEKLRAEGRKPSIRFHVPDGRQLAFDDDVRGHVSFASDDIGDFIIVRPDGIPTYNFAVVLDDHLMEISHVIRGEEHLSNTPRQLVIYEALGWTPPRFAHLALILNQDRKKMSKRDESILQFVEQYRELGYLPEAILNFIALLGWSPVGEQEMFSKEELLAQFSMERLSKSPAVFDTDKLNWMNNQYLKQADPVRVAELAVPHLAKAGYVADPADPGQRDRAFRIVTLYQEQLRYAAEIVELAAMFYRDAIAFEEEAETVAREEQVPEVVRAFRAQLLQSDEYSPERIQACIKNVQKETGHKGKALFMPIRAVLTGQTHGRDLNQTIFLLGKETVLKRLSAFLGDAG